MSWTTPRTWTVGQVVGASDLNTDVRDNLNWLLTGRGAIYARSAGNYTTTSTSYADVDGTNLSFAIVDAGTKILITFNGLISGNQNGMTGTFTVSLDGTDQTDLWTYYTTLTGGFLYQVTVSHVLTVAAGSHTIKLRWKTNNFAGGTLTLYGTTPVATMSVQEIG